MKKKRKTFHFAAKLHILHIYIDTLFLGKARSRKGENGSIVKSIVISKGHTGLKLASEVCEHFLE